MSVHPTATIEEGATLGDVSVGAFCHVGAGAKIHDGAVLDSHVVITGDTEIGSDTHIHSFSVLGGAPQHTGCKGHGTRLVIGADTVVREHVTMNRGTAAGGGVTRVGDGGFFMTGAHVAHDCQVGDKVIFANNATLGGHVHVGDGAFLGGLSAIHQHCRIGEYAFVGGCAAVTLDLIPFASAVGNHAHIAGLNIVGLKRRGLARDTIKDLRAAYQLLFAQTGVFQERVEEATRLYGHCSEVSKILSFINERQARPLMTPHREP